MEPSTYRESFVAAGLTRDQAALYESLLRRGSLTAREAALEAKIGRTLGYAVLDQLIEQGLVQKRDEPGTVSRFFPLHPATLQEKVESQQKASERASIALKAILPDLSSIYNLSTGRPGVRFYEGIDGIKQVLDDSLSSKTEIRAYIDNESIAKHIPELNKEYVSARKRLGVKRKNIATDTQENRYAIEGFLPGLTEWRLIPWQATPINTIMQIYDGRVSYFTLGAENLIGVIISDQFIYEFHLRQFEYLWNSPAVYAPPESIPKTSHSDFSNTA